MATHTADVYFNLEQQPGNCYGSVDDNNYDSDSDDEFTTEFTETCKPMFSIDTNRNIGTDVAQINDFGKCGFVAYEQERETTNFSKGGDNTQFSSEYKKSTMKPFDTFRTTQRQTRQVNRNGNVGNKNLHRGAYSVIPVTARTTIKETTHLVNYKGGARKEIVEPSSRVQFTEGVTVEGNREELSQAYTPGPMKMYKANGGCDTNIKSKQQLSNDPTSRSIFMKSTVYQDTPTPVLIGDTTTVKNNLIPCNTWFDTSIIQQLDNNPFVIGNYSQSQLPRMNPPNQ